MRVNLAIFIYTIRDVYFVLNCYGEKHLIATMTSFFDVA